MYTYHDTQTQRDRLKRGECHCSSQGVAHDLDQLVNAGGLIIEPGGIAPLMTPLLSGSEKPVFIFAVDHRFRMRIAPDGDRKQPGAVKHETLFHNAKVRAAGEISIRSGIVADVNDASGSYRTWGVLQTDAAFAGALLRALDQVKAKMDRGLRARLAAKAGVGP